jgi:hypothetical protein
MGDRECLVKECDAYSMQHHASVPKQKLNKWNTSSHNNTLILLLVCEKITIITCLVIQPSVVEMDHI